MTGLSDDARRLLRAGQTAFSPERHELEATRAALAAKLAAGAPPALGDGVHDAVQLGHTAGVTGALMKLALVTIAAAGVSLGYYALQWRSAAPIPQPPAAVVGTPDPAAASAPIALQPSAAEPIATPPAVAPPPAAKQAERHVERLRTRARRPAASVSGAATEPDSAPAAPAAAPVTTAPPASVPTAAPAEEPVVAAASAPPVGQPVAAAEPNTLALEIELIRKARANLQRHQPALVLRELDTYVARFPSGALREEQLALRALALCELGRMDAARTIIRQIQAVAPASPHLIRLERACAATE